MSMSDLVREERVALCDLLLEVGPDAPTLCEGWTTRDLAAHLAVRERRPDAVVGILGGPFAGRMASVTAEYAEKEWVELVALLRDGPPPGPFALPGIRGFGSLHEWFVHHEDVRRANDCGPRRDGRLDDALWRILSTWGPMLMARVRGVGVELVRTTGATKRIRQGSPTVRLVGAPGELLLYLFGRREVAEVELAGDAGAVERVQTAQLGV
jgi:uncharacterized protein (TIGR03085 family)